MDDYIKNYNLKGKHIIMLMSDNYKDTYMIRAYNNLFSNYDSRKLFNDYNFNSFNDNDFNIIYQIIQRSSDINLYIKKLRFIENL